MKKTILIVSIALQGAALLAMDKETNAFNENTKALRFKEFTDYCTDWFTKNDVTAAEMYKEYKNFCDKLLDWRDEKGLPLLHIFAKAGNAAVVEVLILAGADTSLNIHGKPLIEHAKKSSGVPEMIERYEDPSKDEIKATFQENIRNANHEEAQKKERKRQEIRENLRQKEAKAKKAKEHIEQGRQESLERNRKYQERNKIRDREIRKKLGKPEINNNNDIDENSWHKYLYRKEVILPVVALVFYGLYYLTTNKKSE